MKVITTTQPQSTRKMYHNITTFWYRQCVYGRLQMQRSLKS